MRTTLLGDTVGGGGHAHERAELPDAGDVIGGHYRLVRLLGEGMFGRVYVAERTDVPEHRVAIKLLDRAVYGSRNVERELVMLAAASHPHIVQLKDHGVADRYVWLTMPLFEGETLEERLERGPLGLREAYEIFLPVARGLQALHARGLRHQDIKPENVFLARFVDGRVHPVLLDLGVAVECSSDFVAGTVLFGAPEQVAALGGTGSRAPLSEKIDTYCLASTLLRAIVGERYFPGEDARTPLELSEALSMRETEPLAEDALPDLAGEPRQLLAGALSRWMRGDPAERPSMRQMADELDVLLEQERAAAQAELLRQARQKAALARGRVAVAMLLLIGAGAGLYLYSKRETIQLANDLELARAEGAESFDKLDTCVAAHQVTKQQANRCEQAAAKADERHAATIQALAAGAGKEADVVRKLDTTSRELWTCQDQAKTDAEAWSDERGRLQSTLDEQRKICTTEREELQSKVTQLGSDKQACESSLAGATQERDACRAEQQRGADVYDDPPKPPPAKAPPPTAAPRVEPAPPPSDPYG